MRKINSRIYSTQKKQPQRKVMSVLILVLGGFFASHCSPNPPLAFSSPENCEAGDILMTKDNLYFGRMRSDGEVSDDEWRQYLEDFVTPRFPDGLTVVRAEGQFRNSSGVIIKERSFVLTILHVGDDSARKRIQEILSEYINRFQQESVLRDRSLSCARFQGSSE